jgi:hypothetical protein
MNKEKAASRGRLGEESEGESDDGGENCAAQKSGEPDLLTARKTLETLQVWRRRAGYHERFSVLVVGGLSALGLRQ